MKKLLIKTTVIPLLFLTSIHAGPFGLEMGMKLNEIDREAEEIAAGVYLVDVPQPHSSFEKYAIRISPTLGLYYIKAIGKDISTSSYGLELKSEFTEMKEKLQMGYGEGDELDYLLPGSIWNEPRDYMMALIKNERTLAHLWGETDGSKPALKNSIIAIALVAKATKADTGYISIEYYFENHSTAEKEAEAAEDSAL